MANIWEKAISTLAVNLNLGCSYLITTVYFLKWNGDEPTKIGTPFDINKLFQKWSMKWGKNWNYSFIVKTGLDSIAEELRRKKTSKLVVRNESKLSLFEGLSKIEISTNTYSNVKAEIQISTWFGFFKFHALK